MTVRFCLEINTNNAAVVEDPVEAVASALEKVVEQIREGHVSLYIFDANGNRVGSWDMEHEE